MIRGNPKYGSPMSSPRWPRVIFTAVSEKELARLNPHERDQVSRSLLWLLDANEIAGPSLRIHELSSPDRAVYELRIGSVMRAVVRIERRADPDDAVPPVDRILVARILRDRAGLEEAVAEAVDMSVRSEPARAASRTTDLAARVAGQRRAHLRREWSAILAGSPENGVTFSSRRQALLALGFLVAALRMRSRDAMRPLWRPVDWALRTESRTNGFITTVVGAQAIYIVGDDGLTALVTEVWEPCGAAGVALYALSRWLRRVRGIQVATAERNPGDE